MLGAFDVKYMSRTAKKRHVLAYIVVDFTEDVASNEKIGTCVLVALASTIAT